VWGWDNFKNEGIVLRENYFKWDPRLPPGEGKEVDWYKDYYFPFLKKWVERVRGASGGAGEKRKWVFIEPIPNELCPGTWTEEEKFDDMVFAPHW
jgi:hypothetical protein